MNQDLRDHVQLLLRREPTRSLPLGLLRERLRDASAGTLPGPLELERTLGMEPGFRILNALPLLDPVPGSYAPALAAAGLPQPEPRVLLVEDPPLEGEPCDLLGTTRDSLLVLLGREALRPAVAEALAALAEVASRLADYDTGVNADAAARSTTPLPGPRAPAPARRRPPP